MGTVKLDFFAYVGFEAVGAEQIQQFAQHSFLVEFEKGFDGGGVRAPLFFDVREAFAPRASEFIKAGAAIVFRSLPLGFDKAIRFEAP
jgi:hypothetical protein